MKISVGTDNVNFKPVTVKKVKDFLDLATSQNWSAAVFKDNYRNKENFLSADVIALDVDNDEEVKMTIDEAKETFADHKHVIMPSRNHRKEKNGEVKDRFRVLLFLSRPITDETEYYATWYKLQKQFPAIDPACKDPSRYFYPSTECVSYSTKGKLIDPVEPSDELGEALEEKSNDTRRGFLAYKTTTFMLHGAPAGKRHEALYKAARDYNQNNFTEEEFVRDLENMIERTGNWGHSKLSRKDLDTINDAFKEDPKHSPRLPEKAFNFKPIGELLQNDAKLDWLVEGLLTVGGVSLVVGKPKTGKSTLVRQLAKSVARGETFLDRSVKQGTVFYLALEEQEAVLNEQFRTIGITDNDPINIHVGAPLSFSSFHDLEEILTENNVSLLVVDTLFLILNVSDGNNYSEVNRALMRYRELARQTNTHIIFIHHMNKMGNGTNSIAGSIAIHGAVDCAILFQALGKRRFIDTSQRAGKPFNDHELLFESELLTYTLGEAKGFDDEEDDGF